MGSVFPFSIRRAVLKSCSTGSVLLRRVVVVPQRPIVVKLPLGRANGLSIRTYTYVRRSVQCIVKKRRIESECRLASYRSDGSRDEAGSGVWGSVHKEGYFWGEFGARNCNQIGLA